MSDKPNGIIPRSGHLSKEHLESIRTYRYQTCGATPLEIYVYNPFWEFLANYCLPDWLAPNALTLMGLIFPLSALATVTYLDPSLTMVLPRWVWFLSFFADFWYQTVDAIDGKQARRTDNCSPVGQILDHNLDQTTFTCMMIHVSSCLQIGDDLWRMLAIVPGVMSAHYSIEYRTHFTKVHMTVNGMIGATEQLVIVMLVTLSCFFSVDSNAVLQIEVGSLIKIRDIVIIFACLSGLHYNLENLISGFIGAKQKSYALGTILPYPQFVIMMYASSFSSLQAKYPACFIILCGLELTWITALLNLSSMADASYNWLFIEPCIFLSIVFAEFKGILVGGVAGYWYLGFFAFTLVRYLILMNNIQSQICKHMGLRFLRVKDKDAKTDAKKTKET